MLKLTTSTSETPFLSVSDSDEERISMQLVAIQGLQVVFEAREATNI